jgi:plastocyanin
MKKIALLLTAVFLLAAPALGAPTPVKVGDDFFKPGKVTITKGQKVTWNWVGSDTHNVALWKPGKNVDKDDPAKRSSVKTKGSFTYKFRIAGKWRAICEIHPNSMRMPVTVKRPG